MFVFLKMRNRFIPLKTPSLMVLIRDDRRDKYKMGEERVIGSEIMGR